MFWTFKAPYVCGFYYYLMDTHFYNAYFEPVGAYSGGEGNIWISKTPLFFPIVEKTIYYESAVTWDYSVSKFEGNRVDQKAIMKVKLFEILKNREYEKSAIK